ncbi:MAG: HDOD domain-containing protein [Burkholderiaceae bacterium]|nr:HDOD domain-containing protein [Burkholderiaceae bacterium]MBV8444142.1 HDOD domain-containing protein [Hyphomicrobiales bacterium]
MTLEELFAQSAELPTLPKLLNRMLKMLGNEDIALHEIGAQISADPVLGAKTLRLANSAYFGVPRRISDIDAALQMLGVAMVRNLVISCGVVAAFRDVKNLDLEQFWLYSCYTAAAARWLGNQLGHNAETGFTVGLTHGIGQLLMHRMLPGPMQELDAQVHPLSAQRPNTEKDRLGFDHAEAGAELARLWNFPEPIVEAIRAVPRPAAVTPPHGLAALVHVAAWRARVEVLAMDDAAAARSLPTDAARLLHVDLSWVPEDRTLAATAPSVLLSMPPLQQFGAGLEALIS